MGESIISTHRIRINVMHYSVVTPERVSYSDNSVINEGTAPRNVSQLGPPVDVSFLIRNSGPSKTSNVQLDISWPLNSPGIGENYYLYITSIQVQSIIITIPVMMAHSLSLLCTVKWFSFGDL